MFQKKQWVVGTVALCASFLGNAQSYGQLSFPDFSSTAGLTLNGNAAGNVNNGFDLNPVLRLVPALNGQAGSANSNNVVDVTTFSTCFTFRLTDPGGILSCTLTPPIKANHETGADGFTFVIHNDAAGATALGGAGGSLGYGGITPSVAVEWDTWFNGGLEPQCDSNHLGINVNGSLVSVAALHVGPRFDNGGLWFGWIDYDGVTLEVRTNQTGVKPAAPALSHAINIPATIGANTGHVGFTAATGAARENHDIVSWVPFCPPPGPTSVKVSKDAFVDGSTVFGTISITNVG